MWKIEPTDQWTRDAKWYEKKRPAEYAAILNNIDRYMGLLRNVSNSASVQAGFLHSEATGVKAVDQKGGGPNLQETRAYIFPCDNETTIYLITIGNKNDQSRDVKYCSDFVRNLKKTTDDQATS